MNRFINALKSDVPKKRGRKPGKHSSQDYTQTSLYIPIKLRNEVRAELYKQGKEFSGLVEEMLQKWLSEQKTEE